MRFDPLRVLRLLIDGNVEFIVIGGMAGTIHGSPSVTNDLDICYLRSRENLERLAAVLNALNATLRDAPSGVPFLLDAKTLRKGDSFTFTTDAGPLDCLGTPAGSLGYEDLATRAEPQELDGLRVLVCSLDDLIAMKRAAGRPKDRIELEVLGALRDVIDDVPE